LTPQIYPRHDHFFATTFAAKPFGTRRFIAGSLEPVPMPTIEHLQIIFRFGRDPYYRFFAYPEQFQNVTHTTSRNYPRNDRDATLYTDKFAAQSPLGSAASEDA
jgi:hypothetical protein